MICEPEASRFSFAFSEWTRKSIRVNFMRTMEDKKLLRVHTIVPVNSGGAVGLGAVVTMQILPTPVVFAALARY